MTIPLQIDDLDALFRLVRRALNQEELGVARSAFQRLETTVRARVLELENQARCAAEATARGMDILESQERMSRDLGLQKELLTQHTRRVGEVATELELERNAVAEANVDAVFMLDEAHEELQRLDLQRGTLTDRNATLSLRARHLLQETAHLAAANAEAVMLLDRQQGTLDRLEQQAKRMLVSKQRLETQVFEDVLTGLFNVRYLKEQLDREHACSRRYGRELTLVMIDVDHFKRFNDTHGHLAGDAVLERVGASIREGIRAADLVVQLPAPATAARYGGEEFMVMLPETPVSGGLIVAERIRALVASTRVEYGGRELGPVTVSAGVASLRGSDASAHALIERADRALYQAKEEGRNRVIVAPADATHSRRAADAQGG